MISPADTAYRLLPASPSARELMEAYTQLEERGQAADKGFPDNRYLRFEKGEPILTPVEAVPDPGGLDRCLSLIKERMEPIEILAAFADTEFTPGERQILCRFSANPQTSKSARWIRPVWSQQVKSYDLSEDFVRIVLRGGYAPDTFSRKIRVQPAFLRASS